MMLKEKSSPWARLKYLYVLPLAAIAVTAFARPEVSEKTEEVSVVKVNDLTKFVQEKVLQDTAKVSPNGKNTGIEVVGAKAKGEEKEIVIFEVIEKVPEYPGGMDALHAYLKDKVAGSSMKGKAGGRVIVGFTVSATGKVENVKALKSDQAVLNEEAERIVREMPNWTPGKQRNKPVPMKYTVPVMFGNIRFAENKQPLVMVDGQESTMDYLNTHSDMIESFSILKDSAAVSKYGERGVNGVILVSTKKTMQSEENAVPDYLVTGTVVDEQGHPKAGVNVVIPNTVHGTLTDKDGRFRMKALKGGNLWFSFMGYKPVTIAATPTMTVRMEQEVVSLLPELTGDIKSTSSNSGIRATNEIAVYGVGEQPLIIIDGKEATQKDALSNVPTDRIKSISVLKDKASRDVYGDKGKNGVILVTLLTEEEYQTKKNQK